MCVAVHERPSGLRDTVPLGAVMPLDAVRAGGCCSRGPPTSPPFGTARARELATVRRRGWAESVGEREAGVASVSAPVRDASGAVVAAISVSGPIERLGPHPGRRLARAVVGAAQTISGVTTE